MNNAINEIRNTLEATNSRITEAEDRISEIEDRMVEINESERKQEQRIKRNEDNLRDLQDNMKRSNIRIIGVPEEEDRKKDHEKILEEIIAENFPKMGNVRKQYEDQQYGHLQKCKFKYTQVVSETYWMGVVLGYKSSSVEKDC